jgi:hypothetical protein
MLRGGAYYSTAAGQLIASLHLGDDRGTWSTPATRAPCRLAGDRVCELPCG